MQTPLEQSINQVTTDAEPQSPATKKNKKRANPEPAQDMAKSEPEVKKRKIAPPPTTLKTTIATLLHSYSTNLIDFNRFKTEVAELKQSMQNADLPIDKFIELICPFVNNRHMVHINKVRNREGYLQWTVDEIEAYFIQLTQEERLPTGGYSIIENILNCIGYENLNLLTERPEIKQQLVNNYAYVFITFLQPYLPIAEILAEYFPGELGEQLKTKNIQSYYPATFLDLLYAIAPIATFDYWKQGFRPYSQAEFNSRFFSITAEPTQLLAIYQEIVSDECYRDLCSFSHYVQPWQLFLSNPVINLELFQQLIEKTQSWPNLKEINRLCNSSLKKDLVYIQKIIYCISRLPEPLNTPADALFAQQLKTGLPAGLQPPAPLPQQAALPQITVQWLQQYLVANATEAAGLFFGVSVMIFKSKSYGELTNLWNVLKEKQGEPKQLFKSYLLAYQFTNPLLAHRLGAGTVSPTPIYPLPVLTESYLIEIKQALAHFATQLSATELSQSVESLINFSYWTLIHLANNQPFTTLPGTTLSYFAQFNAELINIIPEDTLLSPQSYFPISRILFSLVSKMELENKASVPHCFSTLISSYSLSKNRKKECLGALFPLIIMHYVVGPKSKDLCPLMDQLSNLEPSWLNHLAQEVRVSGQEPEQTRNLFTTYSKLFSLPNLAQDAAEILAYLLEKIRDNEQVILPEQFLKEIAEWQLNLQKRAQLNAATQTLLDAIYNHCIHKTQNTPQEKTFEEIRTQLLIKFNADPTQEAQAIHSRENHEFSELIYSAWMNALGDTETLRMEKIAQGKDFFIQLIPQKEAEVVEKQLEKKSREFLLKFPSYLFGARGTGFDAECQPILESMKPYMLVKGYLNQIIGRAKLVETPTTTVQQRQRIKDAKKLLHLICAIAYYAKTEQESPEPFRITDKEEALNILLLELIDQASNPSCDQGPFMRILIALEPATEYHFPFLTRRSIQFYVNEYINAFYTQQSEADRKSLLQEIYVRIEDKNTLTDIDYLPEHTFSFLCSRFLDEYAPRMGHITAKEIELLFSIERPQAYHPLLVTDLNQYHQEQRAALLSPAMNPNGFFITPANQGRASVSAMDVDEQPENKPVTSRQNT
ncbi:hypothetical protein ACD661_03520 [Legionella lytica]|uniref:Dot/Icm T4SS effector n=1 Tax=Legionella lytica TaxID=96232 RepID=A0ABW8D800_9GAMM